MTSKEDNHPLSADTGQSEDEGLYARWSRRKSQATEQSATPVAEIESAPTAPEAETEAAEKPPLPDLDTLNEDSDYSGFLSPEVDEKLRKLALRKLFHLPQFNICDGLDDYDEDFRNFEPLGDIVTADMRFQQERQEKLEAERLAREQETPLDEDVATVEDVDEVDEKALAPEDSPDRAGDISQEPEIDEDEDSTELV